jgi:hypothetical protein
MFYFYISNFICFGLCDCFNLKCFDGACNTAVIVTRTAQYLRISHKISS